jgi:hypothetical protein
MMVTIRSSSSEVSSPALYMSVMPLIPSPDPCIPLVQVDISLLADQVGVPAADTLYLGESIDDLSRSALVIQQKGEKINLNGTFNVCIEQTENLEHSIRYGIVFEVALLGVLRGLRTHELEVRLLAAVQIFVSWMLE